jgi:hypothetical protein
MPLTIVLLPWFASTIVKIGNENKTVKLVVESP